MHPTRTDCIRLSIIFLVAIVHFVQVFNPPQSATLLHPVTGDIAYAGLPYLVLWTLDQSVATLNLYLEGDGYNRELATNISNTGSWEWDVEINYQSSSSLYIVLNGLDWNTNAQISSFRIVLVEDQSTTMYVLH